MPLDLYDEFTVHTQTLGWTFSYGNASNQNLLSSSLNDSEIYLLLDTITRVRLFSEFGGEGEQTFSGSFMLLIKSNLDNVYDSQRNQDPANGKYQKNIKPLLDVEIVKLEDEINCSQFEIKKWEIVDAIDVLDVNLDGIVVTYELTVLS